jgi:ABC-type uncharacterized transport system substrate-binding protein
MKSRREFITLLGSAAAAWPVEGRAQSRRARIGWFTVAPHPYIDAFRRGMREQGWIEGENLVIEATYADGHPERLPGLAAVLARVPYDLIVVSGSDAVEAARAAVQSIPLVGVSSTVGMGGSLARSEGNLTGIALLFDEVASKWLELIVEAVPRVQRVGAVFDPSPNGAYQFSTVAVTAERMGKAVLPPGCFGLLIDRRFRDFRQGLVCRLFLVQRFLEQFGRVIETELFRPGLQRPVARIS